MVLRELDRVIEACRIRSFRAKELASELQRLTIVDQHEIDTLFGDGFFELVGACRTTTEACQTFCDEWKSRSHFCHTKSFPWIAVAARLVGDDEFSDFLLLEIRRVMDDFEASGQLQKGNLLKTEVFDFYNETLATAREEIQSRQLIMSDVIHACRLHSFNGKELARQLKQLSGEVSKAFGSHFFEIVELSKNEAEACHVFCDNWLNLYSEKSCLFVMLAAQRSDNFDIINVIQNQVAIAITKLKEVGNLVKATTLQTEILDRYQQMEVSSSIDYEHGISRKRAKPSSRNRRLFHKTVNVPSFASEYYSRPDDEQEILTKIVNICNNPGKGALVIAGDGGVGKTTLMAHLLSNKTHSDGSQALARKTIVIWLNCFQWLNWENLNESERKSFTDEMLRLARLADPNFCGLTIGEIGEHLMQQNDCHVLFVLDDMFSLQLLVDFYNAQADQSQLSCCVITRDPVPLILKDSRRVESIKKIDALTDDGICHVLKTVWNLDEKLGEDEERIGVLAKMCSGLLLIASLIGARFKFGRRYDAIYADIVKCRVTEMEVADDNKRRFQTVLALFSFSVDQLEPELRQCYYVFLLFNPAELISKTDLAIFWAKISEKSVERILDNFEMRSLVRPAEKISAFEEDSVLVHQILWEAALAKATAEFHLDQAASDDARLEQIRMKQLTLDSEMSLFETTRQQRRYLLRQIVGKFSRHNLTKLCIMESPVANTSFIRFLYQFNLWKENTNGRYGRNVSYRLIRDILLKLRSTSGMRNVEDPDPENQIVSSFMGDLYDQKEVEDQYYDRDDLLRILTRWTQAYEEGAWKKEMLGSGKTTKMLMAAIENDVEGLKANYDDTQVAECLVAAARCNNMEIVDTIVAGLASENKSLATAMMETAGGLAPIYAASQNGHVDMVARLAEECPDSVCLQVGDSNSWTPLHVAAVNDNLEVVKWLVEKYPQTVSTKDKEGRSAFYLAALNGHCDILDLLATITLTSNQQDNEGWTPLYAAARNGHLDTVKLLTRLDPASITVKNNSGWSALSAAALNGHIDVVKFLADLDKASVWTPNNSGKTPLLRAAENGHLDVVKWLAYRHLPSVETADNNGTTPLQAAEKWEHMEIVEFLRRFTNAKNVKK